jgi:hypothetical protein
MASCLRSDRIFGISTTMTSTTLRLRALLVAPLLVALCLNFALPVSGSRQALDTPLPAAMARSLSFAATFDRGLDADWARGDARIHSATAINRQEARVGLGGPGVDRPAVGGRSGGALRFTQENQRVVYYPAKDNFPYRATGGWSGTISYFLSLDPEKDLPESWSDPLQITERAWNDAAFWNDFTKDDRPRKFRLGVLADLKVWNPDNQDFDLLPDAEKPAVVVDRPPFAAGEWTHVLVTFERFNTGLPNGEARLYLNGKLQGVVKDRNQQYTWDPDKTAIFLGLSFAGLIDDVMLFDRALSEEEIQWLARRGAEGKPLFSPPSASR